MVICQTLIAIVDTQEIQLARLQQNVMVAQKRFNETPETKGNEALRQQIANELLDAKLALKQFEKDMESQGVDAAHEFGLASVLADDDAVREATRVFCSVCDKHVKVTEFEPHVEACYDCIESM